MTLTAHAAYVASFATRAPEAIGAASPTNVAALRAAYRDALRAGALTPKQQADYAARARAALRRNPLSVSAVAIVGMQADASGAGAARVRPLMVAAERLSRRDLLMQLWLLEDAVNQDDVPGALRHYDRAMSIYSEAEPLLLPILANALDSPEVRGQLLGYVKAQRPWVRAFLDYATGNAAPAGVMDLLIAADNGPRPTPFTRPFEVGLLRNTVAAQDFGRARLLAARIATKATAGWEAIQPTKSASAADLRPLTWSPSEEQAFRFDFDGNTAVLDIDPDGVGIALYRVLFLRPGTYRFAQQLGATGAEGLHAQWDFTCLGTAPATFQSVPALPAPSPAVEVSVPAGCVAVRVALVVGGTDRASRSTLRFERLELRPSGQL